MFFKFSKILNFDNFFTELRSFKDYLLKYLIFEIFFTELFILWKSVFSNKKNFTILLNFNISYSLVYNMKQALTSALDLECSIWGEFRVYFQILSLINRAVELNYKLQLPLAWVDITMDRTLRFIKTIVIVLPVFPYGLDLKCWYSLTQ